MIYIRSKILLLIVILLGLTPVVSAQNAQDTSGVTHTDSVAIHFRRSKWNLDKGVGQNAAVLDSIDKQLTAVCNDSVYRLQRVSILGGASPEGSVEFNKFLSEQRARTLFNWFDRYSGLSDFDKTFTFKGRDWEGVLRLAEKDENLPYRDETLSSLRQIVIEKQQADGAEPKGSLERMQRLRGGVPYRYLYKNIFPAVRASKMVIDYVKILSPEIAQKRIPTLLGESELPVSVGVELPQNVFIAIADNTKIMSNNAKPFYMDLRTNMLYDALALPNIGVEFYLGRNLSLGANWLYGWWKTDSRQRYWRAYGGELFGRWWFSKKAHEKPLTGHHLGLYAQLYTYDFELGGTGEIGGKPGGNLRDKCLWGAGVEYGYSFPVARRINIDLSLGLGYTTGVYHKYKPQDGHYVWQSTHRRKYFGPTKLEVAFVWLIGHGNENRKKGGEQ